MTKLFNCLNNIFGQMFAELDSEDALPRVCCSVRKVCFVLVVSSNVSTRFENMFKVGCSSSFSLECHFFSQLIILEMTTHEFSSGV